MSLTAEWRRRIDHWRRELLEQFYRPLGEVDVAGFVTLDQLPADEAAKRDFAPMPKGDRVGREVGVRMVQGGLRRAGAVTLDLRPFEIATVRLALA